MRRRVAVSAVGAWLKHRSHKKTRGSAPGPVGNCRAKTALRALLGKGLLDRLVRITSHGDIHLTEFRHLRDISIISLLGVLRLDLDRLLDRLRAYQLLEGLSTILERFLGIVSELGGNSLPAFVHLTK